MDIRSLSSKYGGYSIDQYCPPTNYELAGKEFKFIMDDGFDYRLRVIDEKKLEWNIAGEEPSPAEYLCQKGDETTYLFSFVLEDVAPRVSHTFVIDLENIARTPAPFRAWASIPKTLISSRRNSNSVFIEQEGAEPPFRRHAFTSSDLIGTVIEWTDGAASLACTHITARTFTASPTLAIRTSPTRSCGPTGRLTIS
jgi:hypothetical protein